ncbi:MAG: hypothetical protein AB8B87_10660 [Granulosicoccus sp.]
MPGKDTSKSSDEASTRKQHKDWFDKAAANAMANQVAAVYNGFDQTAFKRKALKGINKLEFGDRVRQFSDALQQTLPPSYPKAIAILVKSLPTLSLDAESVTDGWLQWPVGQFIADYGTDHFDESMQAMVQLTQRFSSEFAVRPFIARYPKQTLDQLLSLTDHPSEHVRRWCSEGSRTRLPWGMKLHNVIDNPKPVWPILQKLLDDESQYVRRSVANNINDLSKDHPGLVIKKCTQWKKKTHPHRDWIIKHGLRGLIKAGNSEALKLTGFSAPQKITAQLSVSPKTIEVGGLVQLSASLTNNAKKTQALMIDYVVHYVRKNNVRNGKVFKWKTIELAAGESIALEKKQPMKTTSIRALYTGMHKVEIQVNGQRLAETQFQLK